jgi:hypothetical protein
MSDPGDEPELVVTVPPAHQAGVWANWAAVTDSDHEFTVDFARVDHSVEPPLATVVARIAMSPKMLRQLTDQLSAAWDDYAKTVVGGVLPEPPDDEAGPDPSVRGAGS